MASSARMYRLPAAFAHFCFVWLLLATPGWAPAQLRQPAPSARDLAYLYDKANRLYAARDWPGAAQAYAELCDSNKFNGEFFYRLASARYNLKQYQEALEAYRTSAALGFRKGTSLYNQACCLALLGQDKPAVEALELAIAAGLKPREELIRTDADLDGLRQTRLFQERILPEVPRDLTRTQGWKIDLEYLTRRVDQTHYDPWRHVPRSEWDADIRRILRRIEQLDDVQITVELMKLVTKLKDGHSAVFWPRHGEDAWHRIPLDFYHFTDGVRVRAASPELAELLGLKLQSVGGVAIASVLEQLSSVTAHDNAMQIRWIAPRLLSVTEVLHGLGITQSRREVDLVFQGAEGREIRSSVRAQSMPQVRALLSGPTAVTLGDRAVMKPLYLRQPENFYWHHLLEDGLLYFQYNAVQDKSDSDTIEKFAADLFKMAARDRVSAMVIDVRNNHGGNNFLNQPLIHGLIRTPKLLEQGNLFVITGRETFSACQNFINDIERHTNAVFVGEPSSSRPNFVGEGNVIELPYSGLLVNASSRLWQDSVSEDAREWIAPDLVAELSSEDLANGRDPAMEIILAFRELRR